tara:strand:+ start:2290 stop:3075 length:786 start_codon:yes stop_codon:yes gene_type:complete
MPAKKKSTKQKGSKIVKKITKKSRSSLNTITRHGYSLSNSSKERLESLIKYTNKFGIRKTINQLSKLISRYITDTKVSKKLLKDVKNLQKWLSSKIKKSLKGGAENEKKSSSMVEKLMDLSKKLQKQTASLAKKSTRKVRGTLGRQSSKLENAISGQVQKMNSLSKKIQRKSNNKKNTGKKQNTGKQNTVKNNNNMSFNDHKCELCMQHCTSNGKVKKNNNTMKNTTNNKVKKNSPVERVSRMIIKNQSQRMTKQRNINSN